MKRLIALLMASTLFLTACNSGMKNETVIRMTLKLWKM